jgi:hypothetical protein
MYILLLCSTYINSKSLNLANYPLENILFENLLIKEYDISMIKHILQLLIL